MKIRKEISAIRKEKSVKTVIIVWGICILFALLAIYGQAENRRQSQPGLKQSVPARAILSALRRRIPRREVIRTDITINPGFGLMESEISPYSTAEIQFQMPTTVTPTTGLLLLHPQAGEQGYSVTIGGQVALIQSLTQNFIGVITPELSDGLYPVVVTTPTGQIETIARVRRTVPVFNIHPTTPGNFPGTGLAFAEVNGLVTRFIGIIGNEDIIMNPGETLVMQIGLSGVHNSNEGEPDNGSYRGVAEITTPGGGTFIATANSFNRFVLPGSQVVVVKIPPDFPYNPVTTKLKITVTLNGVTSRNFVIIRARRV